MIPDKDRAVIEKHWDELVRTIQADTPDPKPMQYLSAIYAMLTAYQNMCNSRRNSNPLTHKARNFHIETMITYLEAWLEEIADNDAQSTPVVPPWEIPF